MHPLLGRSALLLLLLLASVAGTVAAEDPPSVTGYSLVVQAPPEKSVVGHEPGWHSRALEPLAVVGPARREAEKALDALAAANRRADGPHRVGIVRKDLRIPVAFGGPLPKAATVPGRLLHLSEGSLWSGRVRVGEAWAVRLRLDEVALPAGSQIWVRSDAGGRDGQPLTLGPFGPGDLDAAGGLWLPAAPGPEVALEVHVPDPGGASFVLGEVGEILHPDAPERCGLTEVESTTDDWTACRIDATCTTTATFGAIENVRQAVVKLLWPIGDGTFGGCSGGLLADEEQSGTPYVLTANHCFATQEEASGLTTYFDYRTETCNGAEPNFWAMPQVSGSTLLATAVENDSTLVRLSGLPAGEVYFLGWTAERPEANELLHTVTHPASRPQSYASSHYFPQGETRVCGTAYDSERDLWHLSTAFEGSTYFGSSGGVVVLDRQGGLVVGSITGVCFNVLDWCDGSTFDNLFGSFEHTATLAEPWLGSDGSVQLIFEDGFESGDASKWTQIP